MKGRTIGRNEPCPCGSGKKYKKCCYGRSTDSKAGKHHVLPHYDRIDYGRPILDETFFRFNTVHEISAPRLLYSSLLMPEIEYVAEQISRKFIERGQKERKIIESTKDVNVLIDIMAKSPDSLNHVKLIDKLSQFKDESIPLIIEELKQRKKNDFIEIAIKAIHRSGKDYSSKILEIIKFYQRNAYAVSQLCMLLGFYQNSEVKKVLWDYYHFFKEHFREETYCDGPLLGLIEMRARRNEKRIQHLLN